MILRICVFVLAILLIVSFEPVRSQVVSPKQKIEFAIVIHGGAGNFSSKDLDSIEEAEFRSHLARALDIGKDLLRQGKNATEVVVGVICYLEDCPLFNAGKGAVLNHDGIVELDASIMNGEDLSAGAVAGVQKIKNPIKGAYLVLTQSEHVMLSGSGADLFATESGLEMVENQYFQTEKRLKSLQEYLEKEHNKKGTVGCVVMDINGNLAAGTSTGGMTNKKYGRIGDSPVIGAGTYADNSSCAVSCTGWGEYFIRLAVAHDIGAQMKYSNISIEEAAHNVIEKKLTSLGGYGGIIAIDKSGTICMEKNTSGMFRAYSNSEGNEGILLYDTK